MKQFEITKNYIIVILIGVIAIMAIYPHVGKIMPPDEGNDTPLCIELSEQGYNQSGIVDTMPNMTMVRDYRLSDSITILKKKVAYYHEFYRKNQPVNVEIGYDTALFLSGNCDSVKYLYPIDTLFIYDSLGNLKEKLPQH